MGDVRFDHQYQRLASAPDRKRELAAMTDGEIVQALAATARHGDADPYLANVLATEALNRMHRSEALGRELAKSEERYRLLFMSIRDPIAAADLERKVTTCNRAFEELTGYRAEELAGRSTSILYADENDWREVGQALRVGDDRADPFDAPVRFRHRSGEAIPVRLRLFYLRGPSGAVIGFVSLVHEKP